MRRRGYLRTSLVPAVAIASGCLGGEAEREPEPEELVSTTVFHTATKRYTFDLRRDDEIEITLDPVSEGLATVSLWSRTEAAYLLEEEIRDGTEATFETSIETPGEYDCTIDAVETEIDATVVAYR